MIKEEAKKDMKEEGGKRRGKLEKMLKEELYNWNRELKGRGSLDKAAKVVRSIIKREEIGIDEIPTKVRKKLFRYYGLDNMLNAFDNSVYKVIDNAYPNKFCELQFQTNGKWKGKDRMEKAAKATKHMIKQEGISLKDIPKKVKGNLFKKYNLYGMYILCFNGSTYGAINNAYLDKFKPWEFTYSGNGIWTGEDGLKNASEATKWMIEKERLALDDIPRRVTQKTFEKYKLGSMLRLCFDNSPYRAIVNAYPRRFDPWEFKYKKNCWSKNFKMATEATKWLIKEKLKVPVGDAFKKVKREDFKRYGLTEMLYRCYNGSAIKALRNAYPQIYKN